MKEQEHVEQDYDEILQTKGDKKLQDEQVFSQVNFLLFWTKTNSWPICISSISLVHFKSCHINWTLVLASAKNIVQSKKKYASDEERKSLVLLL